MTTTIISSVFLTLFFCSYFIFCSVTGGRILFNKFKIFPNNHYLHTVLGSLLYFSIVFIGLIPFCFISTKVEIVFITFIALNALYLIWIFGNGKNWVYKLKINKDFWFFLAIFIIGFLIYVFTFGGAGRNDDASFYYPWILWNLNDSNIFNAYSSNIYQAGSVKNLIYGLENFFPFVSMSLKLFSLNNIQILDPNFFIFYGMGLLFFFLLALAIMSVKTSLVKNINSVFLMICAIAVIAFVSILRMPPIQGLGWTAIYYFALVPAVIGIFSEKKWNSTYAWIFAFLIFNLYFFNSASIFINLFFGIGIAFLVISQNPRNFKNHVIKIFGFFFLINLSLFYLLIFFYRPKGDHLLGIDNLTVLSVVFAISAVVWFLGFLRPHRLSFIDKSCYWIKNNLGKTIAITYAALVLLSILVWIIVGISDGFSLNNYFAAFNPTAAWISITDNKNAPVGIIISWVFAYSIYVIEMAIPIILFWKHVKFNRQGTVGYNVALFSVVISAFFFNYFSSYFVARYMTTPDVFIRTNRLLAPLLITYLVYVCTNYNWAALKLKVKAFFFAIPSTASVSFLTVNFFIPGHNIYDTENRPNFNWFYRNYSGLQDIVNQIALENPNKTTSLIGDVEGSYLFNYNLAPAYPRFPKWDDDNLFNDWVFKKMDLSENGKNIQSQLNDVYSKNVDYIIKYRPNCLNFDESNPDLIVGDSTTPGYYLFDKKLSDSYGNGLYLIFVKY